MYKKVIDLRPADNKVYKNLARVYIKIKRYSDAEIFYK